MINKTILLGRLTRDPEIRYSQGAEPLAIARYTLAVNRRFKKDGEPDADFINCVAFGKNAEFAEKFMQKGARFSVVGHLQTGSYEKDGIRRYTTDVIVEEQYFTESKSKSNDGTPKPPSNEVPTDGFVSVNDDFDADDNPF